MKEKKFNKGDWSEFYAFLKILADRKICAADEKLEKITDVFYPIRKVLRVEGNENLSYDISDEQSIRIIFSDRKTVSIDSSTIKSSVKTIFNKINSSPKGGLGIFDEAKAIMEELRCCTIKADRTNKADIKVIIHDSITLRDSEVGFSIKSNIGANPTLLNASQATNFTYEVIGEGVMASDPEVKLEKVREDIEKVRKSGGEIKFDKVKNLTFEKNLRKIDSLMPIILSEFVISFFEKKASSVKDLCQIVAKSDVIKNLELGFDYEDIKFKLKQLLLNVALGMVPTSLWDGFLKADGGYIVVKEDGELVCYHIYNIAEFSEYLFNNTKLETASTTRHKFGKIYSDGGKSYINFNLQIRF